MKFEPGALVEGRYEIERELARGGVSTIFVALDRKFGVRVALKVASATGEAYHQFLGRFQREARISYELGKSDGFVRALDWGQFENGQGLFLVLDLVEGAQHLDLASGSLADRLTALAATARLVERIHRLDVVHRDLKPANVFVSPAGEIYLADFGAAKSLRTDPHEESYVHITKPGAVVGSPTYMAPEQFSDPSGVTPLADVYSLGVMLYECLTGAHPYPGQSAVEIMSRQVQVRYGNQPPPPAPAALNPAVGPELDRLCLDSIALEPERRTPSSAEFLRRLLAASGVGGSAAEPVSAAPHPTASTWDLLGLRETGFVPLEELRRTRAQLGPEAFRAALDQTPALFAIQERPIDGCTQYQGQVAFLLRRETGAPAESISLGRRTDADLAVDLVTISKRHVHFERRGAGWVVVDAGSSNGSSYAGETLVPGRPRALETGEIVRLAQHLSLEFLEPDALLERLEA